MTRFLPLLLALLLVACGGSDLADPYPYGAPPKVGDEAPNFTQNDPDGKPVTLSDMRGNVVVLDFWASWCYPCLGTISQFHHLQETFAGRPLKIVSVSLDRNLDDWRRTIRDSSMNWIHTADGNYWNNMVAVRYAITSIPHALLIDKKGVVRQIDEIDYSLIDTLLDE